MKRLAVAVLLASFVGCQKRGAGTSAPSPSTTPTPTSAAVPPAPQRIRVDANELRLIYGADPAAAAEKYTGKLVKVKCPTRTQIVQDKDKSYYVRGNLFEGDRRMLAIVFRIKPTSLKSVEGVAMIHPESVFWGVVKGIDYDPGSVIAGEKAVIVDECDIYRDK